MRMQGLYPSSEVLFLLRFGREVACDEKLAPIGLNRDQNFFRHQERLGVTGNLDRLEIGVDVKTVHSRGPEIVDFPLERQSMSLEMKVSQLKVTLCNLE